MPAIRGAKSKKKTRRYTRDLDQIHADLQSERHLQMYKETKNLEDLPGLGQHYCIECAKWFDSEVNYESHKKGKNHKRRVKQIEEGPHTQKEAEEAVGLGAVDNRKRTQGEAMEIEPSLQDIST